METLTPRRTLLLWVSLLLLGAPALLAGSTGRTVWDLYPAVDPSSPYFSGVEPGLLYVTLPLVVLASLVLVMAPGLMLAAAFARTDTVEDWLLKGFALSVVVLGPVCAVVQALTSAPLVGARFVWLALGCTVVTGLMAWLRSRRSPVVWPVPDLGYSLALAGVPLLLLVALTPKFFWESFNGDGAHAYEASRLLLNQPLPFWPSGSGSVGSYPGVNSILYLVPSSWFLRMFGEIEASVRLPFLLFMVLLYAAIVGVARQARREPLRAPAHALIWLGVLSFSLVMAYSATYDPYCSDIGLPATQDTLLVACFLGMATAFLRGERGWMVTWTVLTLLCSPAGPVLVGGWLVGVVVGFRKRPWASVVWCAGGAAATVLAMGALPHALGAAGLPTPGAEHGAGALLSKFRYVLPTDFRRLLFVLLPCGIYPVLSFFGWRRTDDGSRALLIVAALVFAMYYLMAFVSLHYFVPAMVLPLAAFWRAERPALWKRERPALAGCALLALVSLALALPRTTAIYTGTRTVGAQLDASRLAGYDSMEASYFRGMQLLEQLFIPGWNHDVPERAYAGAALSWSFYAQRAPEEQPANYILADADAPPPANTLKLAEDGEAALYVVDEERWAEHRGMHPAGSTGNPIYAVPRDIMFRRERAFERFHIIDVKGLVSRKEP
jgi:hypothetical protein